MSNALLITNHVASTAIPINRFTKFDIYGPKDSVSLATVTSDAINGVVNELSIAAGERVDVVRQGIAWVEAGSGIFVGSPLTTDNSGRAITANPPAGANVRIAGFADETANNAGDVIRFILAPGVMQG